MHEGLEQRDQDQFDIAAQLAAERGSMLPAYTRPPNATREGPRAPPPRRRV